MGSFCFFSLKWLLIYLIAVWLFDEASRPSVKNSERNKRDDNRHVTYQVTGAEQKRVDQFKKALVGLKDLRKSRRHVLLTL